MPNPDCYVVEVDPPCDGDRWVIAIRGEDSRFRHARTHRLLDGVKRYEGPLTLAKAAEQVGLRLAQEPPTPEQLSCQQKGKRAGSAVQCRACKVLYRRKAGHYFHP